MRSLFWAFLVAFLPFAFSYRILCLFSQPSRSHQIVFRAFTDALLSRGHQLVIASTHPYETPHQNVTSIDWSEANSILKNGLATSDDPKDSQVTVKKVINTFRAVLEYELAHPDIQALIKQPESFDLVVSENHLHAFFAFKKIVKAPLIVICSADPSPVEHLAVGNVVNSVTAPFRAHPFIPPLTLDERFKTVTFDIVWYFITKFFFSFSDISSRYLGQYHEDDKQLTSHIDMLFINSNPLLSTIRPMTPKTITLGFLHIQDPKPLPQDLEEFLNQSDKGVIYCSFGSQIQLGNMASDRLRALFSAFESVDYDILLKYSGPKLVDVPSNVRIFEWLPQNDILAHEKVLLFISQAGQHSVEEAIARQVPVLALPVQGDQPGIAKRVAKLGIGEWLPFESFRGNSLTAKMELILNERESYLNNLERVKNIVLDQQMTPLERAVWWTEYTIRHRGAKHLEYYGASIPLYQYLCLDVIAIYIALTLPFGSLIAFLVKWVRRRRQQRIEKCKIVTERSSQSEEKVSEETLKEKTEVASRKPDKKLKRS